MKKFFITLFMTLGVMSAMCQSQQTTRIATLSHGAGISTYYGDAALKEAYDDAANGDVITLSPGQFTAVDISKSITLRGAGTNRSDDNHFTALTGDFAISGPEEATDAGLEIEGVHFINTITYTGTITDAYFSKCRFYVISTNLAERNNVSMRFRHCRLHNGFLMHHNCHVSFSNSYVGVPSLLDSISNSGFSFVNCVLSFDTGREGRLIATTRINNSAFQNCYLHSYYDSYYGEPAPFPKNNEIQNCVVRRGALLSNIVNSTNKTAEVATVFNSTEWNDYCDFTLKDAAKTIYLGSDGTEIGMYGGADPYNPTPSNPQITKFVVGNASSSDGKVDVEIQIGTPEEPEEEQNEE